MKLISINLGEARTQQRKGYIETTGIYKSGVNKPIRIHSLGLEGDVVIDTKDHGGPDQAVYVYGTADYEWWRNKTGIETTPGLFGDNLTISDLKSAEFNVGDLIHIGEVTLQVTAPRIPCGTFATRMQDPQWTKKFRDAERPGLYCRVNKDGILQAGDPVSIEKFSGDTVSILQMYRDHYTKNYTKESLKKYLNSPIDIRSRKSFEDLLETMQ